jgi:hypothetical protein
MVEGSFAVSWTSIAEMATALDELAQFGAN